MKRIRAYYKVTGAEWFILSSTDWDSVQTAKRHINAYLTDYMPGRKLRDVFTLSEEDLYETA